MQADEQDETLSWRAATVIMGTVTLGTIILRILGLDPFTDIFDAFIVYLPTAILLGTILVMKVRSQSPRTGYAMADQSTVESKAA